MRWCTWIGLGWVVHRPLLAKPSICKSKPQIGWRERLVLVLDFFFFFFFFLFLFFLLLLQVSWWLVQYTLSSSLIWLDQLSDDHWVMFCSIRWMRAMRDCLLGGKLGKSLGRNRWFNSFGNYLSNVPYILRDSTSFIIKTTMRVKARMDTLFHCSILCETLH